jgi:hypothetical protein
MDKSRLESPPSWRDDVAWILRSARSAFRLRILLVAWPWLLLLEALGRGISGVPMAVGFSLLLFLGWLLLAAWVSLLAAGEASGGEDPGWKDLARGVRRSAPALLLAASMTLAIPAFLSSIALAGGLFSRIPWVGGSLWVAWALTAGLILSLAAAGWLLVGLPALLLQPAASVIEEPFGFDLVSRTTSYVRRRPLRLAGGLAAAAVSALLGTLVFALFLSLCLTLLEGIRDVALGTFPDLLLDFQELWPFVTARDSAGSPGPWAGPILRLVPAFFVAALFAGLTRLYLILRREVDGTPLAARRRQEEPAAPSELPRAPSPEASPAP